jgi:hypothetical protein
MSAETMLRATRSVHGAMAKQMRYRTHTHLGNDPRPKQPTGGIDELDHSHGVRPASTGSFMCNARVFCKRLSVVHRCHVCAVQGVNAAPSSSLTPAAIGVDPQLEAL